MAVLNVVEEEEPLVRSIEKHNSEDDYDYDK